MGAIREIVECKTDQHSLWVIVSDDEPTPEWVPWDALDLRSVPVRYLPTCEHALAAPTSIWDGIAADIGTPR